MQTIFISENDVYEHLIDNDYMPVLGARGDRLIPLPPLFVGAKTENRETGAIIYGAGDNFLVAYYDLSDAPSHRSFRTAIEQAIQ